MMPVAPAPGGAVAIVTVMAIAVVNAEMYAGADAADMGSDADTGVRGRRAQQGQCKN